MALLSFLIPGSTVLIVFRYMAIIGTAFWILVAAWFFNLLILWPRRSHLKHLPGPAPKGKYFGGQMWDFIE